MEKVYIVEHKTWLENCIVGVFKNKSDADDFANNLEPNIYSYNEYWVTEFEVR